MGAGVEAGVSGQAIERLPFDRLVELDAGEERSERLDAAPDLRMADEARARRRHSGGRFVLRAGVAEAAIEPERSEEHTSELQSLMRTSYAVFCLKKKKNITTT